MSILAVLSSAGGVGTSTSVTAIAFDLAERGDPTLIIDSNRGGDCARLLGIAPAPDTYPWLNGNKRLEDCEYIAHNNGLRIVRNDYDVNDLERRQFSILPSQRIDIQNKLLNSAIGRHVVIDTPYGTEVEKAVVMAADIVIIPFLVNQSRWRPIEASVQLVKQLNPSARVILLPNRYNRESPIERQFLYLVKKRYKSQVARPIPEHLAISSRPEYGITIWESDCDGASVVQAAFGRLIDKISRVDRADKACAPCIYTKSNAKVRHLSKRMGMKELPLWCGSAPSSEMSPKGS